MSMSRKDPRRRLVVPVTPCQRAQLRIMASLSGRKSSLADRLRYIVLQEMAHGLRDHGAEVPPKGAGLPLQLPRDLFADVDDLAHMWGQSHAFVVQQALTQHLLGHGTE